MKNNNFYNNVHVPRTPTVPEVPQRQEPPPFTRPNPVRPNR